MKSQPSKKITLKLKLDANTFVTKTKPSIPPSSKCSQKTASPTNTTECTVSSSKKYFRNDENKSTCSDDPTKSQLIQYLLEENKHLQKQNEDKEQLINFLSSGKSPKKRLILNTERSTEIKSQKLPQINTKNQVENESTPFCFTFCQLETQSQKSVRVNKLPKEFQIVPNKKRYFI